MSIDLYLQVYIGTDFNTNSEFPNVHCEALKMAANYSDWDYWATQLKNDMKNEITAFTSLYTV